MAANKAKFALNKEAFLKIQTLGDEGMLIAARAAAIEIDKIAPESKTPDQGAGAQYEPIRGNVYAKERKTGGAQVILPFHAWFVNYGTAERFHKSGKWTGSVAKAVGAGNPHARFVNKGTNSAKRQIDRLLTGYYELIKGSRKKINPEIERLIEDIER